MILALLFTATSLLTQAYLFRNLEKTESNRKGTLIGHYREAALAEVATDRLPVETDSSRITESTGDR